MLHGGLSFEPFQICRHTIQTPETSGAHESAISSVTAAEQGKNYYTETLEIHPTEGHSADITEGVIPESQNAASNSTSNSPQHSKSVSRIPTYETHTNARALVPAPEPAVQMRDVPPLQRGPEIIDLTQDENTLPKRRRIVVSNWRKHAPEWARKTYEFPPRTHSSRMYDSLPVATDPTLASAAEPAGDQADDGGNTECAVDNTPKEGESRTGLSKKDGIVGKRKMANESENEGLSDDQNDRESKRRKTSTPQVVGNDVGALWANGAPGLSTSIRTAGVGELEENWRSGMAPR